MSQRIESTLRIMAPREAVWALLQNPARRSEWEAGLVEMAMLTPLPLQWGSRARLTFKRRGGRRFWCEMETLAWNPPERIAFQTMRFSRGTFLRSLGGSWHLHDNGDGSTNWTVVWNMAWHGGLFAPLLERLFARKAYTRRIVQSQQALKRLIESEYVPAPVPAPDSLPLRARRWQPQRVDRS
jgi:uncharacterized protein YndB with AHSA1/START domain